MAHTGSTPSLALPYPLPDDAVDVPIDMKALADRVEKFLAYPTVTALPLSPVNGDRITLDLGDNVNGYGGRFRLERVAGVWLCLGGTPAHIMRNGANTFVSNGNVQNGADGSLLLDLVPGEWIVEWGCTAFRPVSSDAGAILTTQPQGAGLPTLGHGGAPNPDCLMYGPGYTLGPGYADFAPISRSSRFTPTGSALIQEAYTGLNATWSVSKRWMTAWPVRL